jgi:hypothetical protein
MVCSGEAGEEALETMAGTEALSIMEEPAAGALYAGGAFMAAGEV